MRVLLRTPGSCSQYMRMHDRSFLCNGPAPEGVMAQKKGKSPRELLSRRDLSRWTGYPHVASFGWLRSRLWAPSHGSFVAWRRPARQYADPRQKITGPDPELHNKRRRGVSWRLDRHPCVPRQGPAAMSPPTHPPPRASQRTAGHGSDGRKMTIRKIPCPRPGRRLQPARSSH